METKITMKIDNSAHQKLQIVKGLVGAKTLSDTIRILAEEYIELRLKKGK